MKVAVHVMLQYCVYDTHESGVFYNKQGGKRMTLNSRCNPCTTLVYVFQFQLPYVGTEKALFVCDCVRCECTQT